MQQNSAEKYAPKAALNLFQNCREHRFNCKLQIVLRNDHPDILPLSRGQNNLFKRIQLFSGREMPATELFLYERFSRIVFIAGGFLQ